jgi:hypothetical protein
MPETTAQKRQRKLHEAVVAARARREDPREDAAVEKMVAPKPAATSTPAATTETKPTEPVKIETTEQSERIKTHQSATTSPGSNFAKTWGKSMGPKPQAKVYQKHVLFALVSAFLVQIIANGKSLPKAGS